MTLVVDIAGVGQNTTPVKGTFDDRIMKIVITMGGQPFFTLDSSTGDTKRPPLIAASGQKFADISQNQCTVQIGNLPRNVRNSLATNLTPNDYNKQRKSIEVWAGRVSTGMFLRYKGDIITAVPSQPPDIVMTITTKTAYFAKYDIIAQAKNVTVPLSQLAQDTATALGLKLNYVATEDKQITNYSYTGSALDQVDKLAQMGGVDVYIDNDTLVCKNRGQPLPDAAHALSSNTGMVGQIEPTEWGIQVRSMLSQGITLGGQLDVTSVQNPSLNGSYTIVKTGFELSLRDLPYYDLIEATRYPDFFFNPVFPTS